MIPALLAAAPALPLHEAGKYVAGAFVVFVAVIAIYIGIMAVKLQRMSRELHELNAALEARERAESEAGRR
jgi:cell division protein FtsL